METILITGGAGFIGSHLVDRLIKEGYYIVCLDDFNNYYSPRLKRKNIVRHLTSGHFVLVEGNITNRKILKSVFKNNKIDIIVHLAAQAGVYASFTNPLLYQKVNILGTVNSLDLAKSFNVKQFIFASSSSVYGENKPPFSEDQALNTPLSPYASSKIAAEAICYFFHHFYNLPITILRFFSVYGPRGRPDMAPYLFTKAILTGKAVVQYGDGSSSRDWTYIDDIVEGIIRVVRNPFPFAVINLGNNHPITLLWLIKQIEEACGKKANIKKLPKRAGEMQRAWADITKAKKLLDWQPKFEFADGIKLFVNWFKKNRVKLI